MVKAALIVALVVAASPALAECLTSSQAREKWPNRHLMWRIEHHCWMPRGLDLDELKKPEKKAEAVKTEAKSSWLDRVSENAPHAEIWFPSLVSGDRLNSYPLLIWPQPWLSPNSMLSWPVLLDADRAPFTVWNKRVGE